MTEEMLPCIGQNFKQLIAGAQPWQKHHFLAKEFIRKKR